MALADRPQPGDGAAEVRYDRTVNQQASDQEDEDDDEGPDLGPDERDLDLMDGTWEQRYYAGRARTRDWNAVIVGVSILVLAAFLVPLVLVAF